jgi:predicted site-specific integrase-resolvase
LAKRKSFEGDILNAIYDHDLTNTREIAEFVGSSMSTAYRWLADFRDKEQVKAEKTDGSWDYEPLDESFEDVELTYKITYDTKREGAKDLELELTVEARVRTGLSDDEVLQEITSRPDVQNKGFQKLLSAGLINTTVKDGVTYRNNNVEHLANSNVFDHTEGKRTGIERLGKTNRTKKSHNVEGQFRGGNGKFKKL